MPVTTVSAAVHLTPVVLDTFLKHGKRKAHKLKHSLPENEAKDDIFFDEAFTIVKSFLDMTTRNTVESTQAFMNTHVPAPPSAAVSPVKIPFASCNKAADVLIDWFGPNELKHVVGGERWWQVRGMDYLDAEWVTQKDLLRPEMQTSSQDKLSSEDKYIPRMEDMPVMLYVHGGGYFWGSINTHRYQIIRYAKQIKARAFAVNYRKAPQYPWPCPLQDVLAAYFYLIHPPPGALHKPIPPHKIVLAGDSAGGGLSITVLTVLRDLGLPLPAGAVLISPWVDLTHSFPSVMENADGDIIPNSGFIYKPSATWPVDPIPPEGGRIIQAKNTVPPLPGDADTLKPSAERVTSDMEEREEGNGSELGRGQQQQPEDQEEMFEHSREAKAREGDVSIAGSANGSGVNGGQAEEEDLEQWEPKPPKVLMNNPEDIPLEIKSQIQLYATTEQLTHPLVSPILQGSLGNLPPLYIIGGNEEVLRDEIIYLAHRAADPEKFPIRKGALKGHRQRENVERFTKPTEVKLQIFDDMCHVLTVFTFTRSAEYAYKSIAEFFKRVTTDPQDSSLAAQASQTDSSASTNDNPTPSSATISSNSASSSDTNPRNINGLAPGSSGSASSPNSTTNTSSSSDDSSLRSMIRERVDIFGETRPLEPCSHLRPLKIPSSSIGLIKEDPARRWERGQTEWDKRYHRAAKRALQKRRKIEAKTERLVDHARSEGFVLDSENPEKEREEVNDTKGVIQRERRWGPLDLEGETPPPSAIAGRRDTLEAYALIKKHIYHTAPRTHMMIPKVKPGDAIRAAFDPDDDPLHPPRQSVSEQQVKTKVIPVHGLKMWDSIIGYFMRKSSAKAVDGVSALASSASEQVSSLVAPIKSSS